MNTLRIHGSAKLYAVVLGLVAVAAALLIAHSTTSATATPQVTPATPGHAAPTGDTPRPYLVHLPGSDKVIVVRNVP